MDIADWSQIHAHILTLEDDGLVTRTFRRLDPVRQQRVLNAILEEAVERGPTEINIKNIAIRAGVSVGSLYNYFKNRESLLDFAVELCSRYMVDIFAAYKPTLLSMPIRQGFEAYILGGLEWSQTQTGLVQFFLRAAYEGASDLQDRFVRPIAEIMLDYVRDILTYAIARGEVKEDIDLEATTRIIHALTIAVGDSQLLPYLNNYMRVTDDTMEPERIMGVMLDLILKGISTETYLKPNEGTS